VLNRQIKHYRLLEKLGSGGMGEVYRAEDGLLQRQIALKILSPARAAELQNLERFKREACSAAALNHPSVVTIYSVEEHEGLHFLTMELIQGQTLTGLIQPGGMPLRRFTEIALSLAEALEAAHAQGIVHRDLKPDNVMVSREGRVKVLDFGIAKSARDATVVDGEPARDATLTQAGLIIGTPAYMAPEQIVGEAVDHRADLFTFGVLLYETATGQRPFPGSTASEVFPAVLRDTPPPPSSLNPQIPAVVDELIAGCLEKDPGRRVQSAAALRERLQALLLEISSSRLLPAAGRKPARWKSPAFVSGILGIAAVALLLAWLGWRFIPRAKPAAAGESHRPGLAVLPLGNFSNDPEYFADGMTDALISSLSSIQGVRVISRQSVMRYKKSSEPLPRIAKELGVDMIVQGSVIHAGNRLRITAQLIRAQPEQQIWTQSYERDVRDVLTLQSEVARAISEEIQVKLEPGDQKRLAAARPVDPQAYDAYLQGRYAWNRRTSGGLTSAVRYLQEALDRDSRFAPAHAGLANVYTLSAIYGVVPPAEAFAQARHHADAALEIDPELADAYVSLGLIHLFADRDWSAAEDNFRRALTLKPNDSAAHHFYVLYLMARGRDQEVGEELRRAAELDPLSPVVNLNLGYIAARNGHAAEAMQCFQKAQALAPDLPIVYLYFSDLYRQQGKADLDFLSFRKALELRFPEIMPAVDAAYAKGGRKAALQTAATALEKLAKTKLLPPEDIAHVYAEMGDRGRTLDFLEESYRRGFPGAVLFASNQDWEWDLVRNEPRFRALIARIGRSEHPQGNTH
jgi:serine/threonine protein kinase/cytochrome c-type biogenesis protein CcmH/NrfG